MIISVAWAFLAIGLAVGLIQEVFFSQADEQFPIDLWTFAHFFAYAGGVMLLFLYLTAYTQWWVLFLALNLLGLFWEPIEQIYLFNRYPQLKNFLYEMPLNPVFDVLANLGGSLFGVVLFFDL